VKGYNGWKSATTDWTITDRIKILTTPLKEEGSNCTYNFLRYKTLGIKDHGK